MNSENNTHEEEVELPRKVSTEVSSKVSSEVSREVYNVVSSEKGYTISAILYDEEGFAYQIEDHGNVLIRVYQFDIYVKIK